MENSTPGSVVHPGLNGTEPIETSHLLKPNPSNRRLIPVSGLKIHRQAIPVTIKDKAYGKRKIFRKRVYPSKRRSKKRASKSPTPMENDKNRTVKTSTFRR